MSATGRLDELVDRVSEWFETILHRPVERLEWWHDGAPYAVRYQLADTAEGYPRPTSRTGRRLDSTIG